MIDWGSTTEEFMESLDAGMDITGGLVEVLTIGLSEEQREQYVKEKKMRLDKHKEYFEQFPKNKLLAKDWEQEDKEYLDKFVRNFCDAFVPRTITNHKDMPTNTRLADIFGVTSQTAYEYYLHPSERITERAYQRLVFGMKSGDRIVCELGVEDFLHALDSYLLESRIRRFADKLSLLATTEMIDQLDYIFDGMVNSWKHPTPTNV